MSMRAIENWQRFFLAMATPKIVGNGIEVSLVVGTLLNLINQGEDLISGQGLMIGHALLNYLVPFCVACYSGARALPLRASGGQVLQQKDT